MRENQRNKLVNILCWLGLALIGGYSYLSSMYLSSFAETRLIIPKINLPVFIGEIVLFFVILFAGLIFFLKKNKTGVKARQFSISFWFAAAFFAFIVVKALLGLSRHGFLAFRNAAMFYYLFFIFAAYYFYRPRPFKPVFRYVALIVLAAIVIFFPPRNYFLYVYYAFMLILVLKERGRRLGFAVLILSFVIFLRRDDLLSQAKSGLVSLGFVTIYLIFSLAVYLRKKIKNHKAFVYSLALIIVVPVSAPIFMMNSDLHEFRVFRRLKSNLNVRKYSGQYKIIKGRIASRLAKGMYSPKVMPKGNLYQSNPNYVSMYKKAYTGIMSEKSSVEARTKKIDVKARSVLPENKNNVKAPALEKKINKLTNEIDKEVFDILVEDILKIVSDDFARATKGDVVKARETGFKKVDSSSVSKEIVASKEKKVQKMVKNKVRKILPQSISHNVLEVVTAAAEAEARNLLVEKADIVAEQIVAGRNRAIRDYRERSASGDLNNIMWRVFVWKDMWNEALSSKKNLLWGVDFGYPFRSRNMEVLKWDDGGRVGWLEPHNSYLHIFYRSGLTGIALIIVVLVLFIKMAAQFAVNRNTTGVMLASILLYWLSLSCFKVVLELPYYAIPFWSLFGITLKYSKLSERKQCR